MSQDVKQKILEVFKNQPLLASFATVTEDNKPWVRYVTVIIEPESFELRFATFIDSKKVKHIAKEPNVHLTCGINDIKQFPGAYLQIQGTAKLSTSLEEREHVWHPDLQAIFEGVNDSNYGVVIVKPYHMELIMFDSDGIHSLVWK